MKPYRNGEHPWTGRFMVALWGTTLFFIVLMVLLAISTPPAGATPGEVVHVHTDWGPAPCIQLSDPSGTHVACGGYADATYYAYAGELVGVDPIIGTNSWVSCYIAGPDNVAFFSDYGTLGNGHDINCYGQLVLGSNPRMLT